ncbi:DNA adenine methylase [Flectobacillus roseus]|uniref:site-specific DNA-methyltransferase (adenine-specific) n=1 Tax=Flectobacillus roseus TaxID=502259 RepID=A0ABT6Y7U0_9BACT|nr:DNA adenine methylase [Flectobacillus roseus]MDI9859642.1 DNA adenine methylase [Flectobacillus roseus]
MAFFSPLRYPGGKAKIADFFMSVFEENSLCDGVYIEPYAGGASVGLNLLFNEYASRIIINDLDKSIYAFWYSVLNETDNLCKLIFDNNVDIPQWKVQKDIQRNKENSSLLELGYSTFFLNRTNRSGIIRAGVIGGIEQSGDWKMDVRFNKNDLINRIQKIALYKDRIKLYNLDAVKLLKTLRNTLPENSLMYFDPPYYVKGKELYMNFFTHEDHSLIYNEIAKSENLKWIVTYDNVEEITNLYQNYRQLTYSLNYSAGNATKGKEVLIYSDNIILPVHNLHGCDEVPVL